MSKKMIMNSLHSMASVGMWPFLVGVVSFIPIALGPSVNFADWEEALDNGAEPSEVLTLAREESSEDNADLVEAARALGYTANSDGLIRYDEPLVEVIDGRRYISEGVVDFEAIGSPQSGRAN